MTKPISLTHEAYNLLRSMKLKGESFSDTIKHGQKKGKLSEVRIYPELHHVKEFEEPITMVFNRFSERGLEIFLRNYHTGVDCVDLKGNHRVMPHSATSKRELRVKH